MTEEEQILNRLDCFTELAWLLCLPYPLYKIWKMHMTERSAEMRRLELEEGVARYGFPQETVEANLRHYYRFMGNAKNRNTFNRIECGLLQWKRDTRLKYDLYNFPMCCPHFVRGHECIRSWGGCELSDSLNAPCQIAEKIKR